MMYFTNLNNFNNSTACLWVLMSDSWNKPRKFSSDYKQFCRIFEWNYTERKYFQCILGNIWNHSAFLLTIESWIRGALPDKKSLREELPKIVENSRVTGASKLQNDKIQILKFSNKAVFEFSCCLWRRSWLSALVDNIRQIKPWLTNFFNFRRIKFFFEKNGHFKIFLEFFTLIFPKCFFSLQCYQ